MKPLHPLWPRICFPILLCCIGISLRAQPGAIDPSFDVGTGANDIVWEIMPLADGKILVSGSFTEFNGTTVGRIVRLEDDGTIDPTFQTGTGFNGQTTRMALQPDGKLLICGNFTSFDGVPLNAGLARLMPDGTLDQSFVTFTFGIAGILDVELMTDGRILIAGNMGTVDQNRVCRLLPNGALDPTFSVPTAFNTFVNTVNVFPDGRVLAVGPFTQVYGIDRPGTCILLESGALDPTYAPTSGFNSVPQVTTIMDNNMILFGGFFTSFNGETVRNVARVDATGILDPSFMPEVYGGVYDVLPLPNGNVWCAGNVAFVPFGPTKRIARFFPSGILDTTFDHGTGPNAIVRSIVQVGNDQLYVGGQFTTYDGQPHSRIVRLLLCNPVDWFADDDGDGSGDPNAVLSACNMPSGYVADNSDCDDTDPAIGGPQDWYADTDGDGFGDQSAVQNACFAPSGYVPNSTDCNDGDPLILMASTWYADADSDGAGDPATFTTACVAPAGHVANAADCNDSDPATQGPITWYLDADNDGFGNVLAPTQTACTAPVGHVADNTDCNDSDPAVLNVRLWYADVDGDGFGDAASSAFACTPPTDHVGNDTDCDDSDPAIGGPQLWYADADGDGNGDPVVSFLDCTQPINTSADATDCDDTDPEIYPFAPCDDGDQFTYYDEVREDCVCRGYGIRVSPVVWLEGVSTPGQLMRGDLYNAGLIPLTEPYTALDYPFINGGGGETTTPELLNPFPGNDELMAVDWVIVELRDNADPGVVVDSRACILRRNGVIHKATSMDAPEFHVAQGPYHVAVRHRNHLGVMTAAPITLDQPAPPLLEWAFGVEPTLGLESMKPLHSRMVLWAGDAGFDGNVQYTGSGNDRDMVLTRIGGVVPTNTVTGYHQEDLNMDGVVKYTGSANDRDMILQTIGGIVPTYIRVDYLPD